MWVNDNSDMVIALSTRMSLSAKPLGEFGPPERDARPGRDLDASLLREEMRLARTLSRFGGDARA